VKLSLSAEEMETLSQLSVNHKWADVRKRASGLLLIAQGVHTSEVMKRLGVGQTSQYNWLRSWNTLGIVGLLTGHAGGRPAKLTEKWIKTCVKLSQEHALSAAQIAQQASQIHGEPFPNSLSSLRGHLKNNGLSYKRTRMSLKKKGSSSV
jgi:transposase